MGRKCAKCGVIKALSAFDPMRDNKSELQKMCRECITTAWINIVGKRLDNIETIRKNNPDAYDRMVKGTLFTNASKRAKKMGVQFTITRDDIPLVHTCPVFNVPLRLHVGKQGNDSYSLDRIDSTLGYIPGNVRVISWRANYLKGNLTLAQAEALYNYMRG